MGKPKYLVPMSSPDINDADRQAVAEVLSTNYLSMGPKNEAFEIAVAAYSNVSQAISVNSGTAGLHLCVRASGFKPGGYIITTPFSFVSSTNVLYLKTLFQFLWTLIKKQAILILLWSSRQRQI